MEQATFPQAEAGTMAPPLAPTLVSFLRPDGGTTSKMSSDSVTLSELTLQAIHHKPLADLSRAAKLNFYAWLSIY